MSGNKNDTERETHCLYLAQENKQSVFEGCLFYGNHSQSSIQYRGQFFNVLFQKPLAALVKVLSIGHHL